MMQIIHFTTVHPRADTRIRVKQVATLSRHWPGQVALFVQDGLGDEQDPSDAFIIHDTGPRPRGRLRRMTFGAFRMYRAIRRARPIVAHFHDPELLPWAMLLQLQGIRIVYDVHENVPAQIRSKDWLPTLLKPLLVMSVKLFDRLAEFWFTQIVLAEPIYLRNFPSGKAAVIHNYPILSEFPKSAGAGLRATTFVYVGSVTRHRGILEMTFAASRVGRRQDAPVLSIAGVFSDSVLRERITSLPEWQAVDFVGWADRGKVSEMLANSCAGLVTLWPEPNYVESFPVKMFEYMASGKPFIASDFPFWRSIVSGLDCALFVDPKDPQAIADAMQWILDNPEEAAVMGRRGRIAVEERFNWESESTKLVDLYRRLMGEA